MTFFLLVLVITVNGAPAMTSVPDFTDDSACTSAGAGFVQKAIKREQSARFYCVPYVGRGE